MSYSDDDINRLLEGSAERWRETLPDTTEPDIATLVRGARRHRAVAFPLGNVGALAAVVVSVAVLALVVGSLYGAFGPAGTSSPNAAAGPVTGTASPSPVPENSCLCTEPPPTPPAGGISQQAAEHRALALVPQSGTSSLRIVWIAFGYDPFVAWNAPNRKPVWTVRIEGAIAAPTCVPGYFNHDESTTDPMCLDNEGGVDVVLDFYDGSLIGFHH